MERGNEYYQQGWRRGLRLKLKQVTYSKPSQIAQIIEMIDLRGSPAEPMGCVTLGHVCADLAARASMPQGLGLLMVDASADNCALILARSLGSPAALRFQWEEGIPQSVMDCTPCSRLQPILCKVGPPPPSTCLSSSSSSPNPTPSSAEAWVKDLFGLPIHHVFFPLPCDGQQQQQEQEEEVVTKIKYVRLSSGTDADFFEVDFWRSQFKGVRHVESWRVGICDMLAGVTTFNITTGTVAEMLLWLLGRSITRILAQRPGLAGLTLRGLLIEDPLACESALADVYSRAAASGEAHPVLTAIYSALCVALEKTLGQRSAAALTPAPPRPSLDHAAFGGVRASRRLVSCLNRTLQVLRREVADLDLGVHLRAVQVNEQDVWAPRGALVGRWLESCAGAGYVVRGLCPGRGGTRTDVGVCLRVQARGPVSILCFCRACERNPRLEEHLFGMDAFIGHLHAAAPATPSNDLIAPAADVLRTLRMGAASGSLSESQLSQLEAVNWNNASSRPAQRPRLLNNPPPSAVSGGGVMESSTCSDGVSVDSQAPIIPPACVCRRVPGFLDVCVALQGGTSVWRPLWKWATIEQIKRLANIVGYTFQWSRLRNASKPPMELPGDADLSVGPENEFD